MNWERTRFGLPVLVYHWAAGTGGLILLGVYSLYSPYPAYVFTALPFLTLLLMHVAASFLHFQYSRLHAVLTFGAAFTAAALLGLGILPAAWISAAGIFTGTLRRVIERQAIQRKKVPLAYDLSLLAFNTGMASAMWLCAGWIYTMLLKASSPITEVTFPTVAAVIVMFAAMNVVNVIFLYVSNYFQGNEPDIFVKRALIPALVTEMAMAPAGILLAISYLNLGTTVLIFAGCTLLLINVMLRNLSVARIDQETKVRQLTGLNRISRQILALKEEEEVLQLLHTEVPKVLDSSGVILGLSSEDGTLKLLTSGADPVYELAAEVVKNRQAVVLRNTARELPPAMGNNLVKAGIRSLILVPIHAAARILGVIGVYNEEAAAFKDEQVHLLAMIGGETALALENSRLYGDLTGKVSELERLNKQLRQVDRMKSEFLANVSHELRTPLTTIKGYVDYIKREKMGTVSALQQEGLAITQRNILRLQRLIDDLLDYTRMEFKKAPLSLSVCSFDLLWSEVYEEYADQISEKKLSPHVMIPSNLPLLYADTHRITQVLGSLISNAIKFNKPGGVVWIEARVLENSNSYFDLELYAKNCTIESLIPIEISVRDSGVGIPPEAIEKIFDRFYQVDSSYTRRYGGTGLGLAIVKSVLDAHGTKIDVDSSIGEGSTFSFVLPGIDPANLRNTLKTTPVSKHSRPRYVT